MVQAVLVRAVLSVPFKKKLNAASWADAEPVLKGEKTLPPTGGMSAEAHSGMLAVAIHVAWAEALHPGKKWICDPALWWEGGDLQVAPEDEEPELDLDMARQLFRSVQRGVPADPSGRGERRQVEVPPQRRPLVGAASGWMSPSQRFAD